MSAHQRVEKTKGLQRALEARGTERASREALACAWEHRALVARTIRRCLHHRNQISLEMDDLITIGVMGIARGIETYDPERGAFTTYISHWVYQSITRAIDVQGQTIRRPTYLNEVERKRAKDPDIKVTEAAAYAVDTRWAPVYSLHGTQGIYYLDRQGRWCSSKGLLKQGLMLVESDTNYYWLAAKKTDLWDKMQDLLENSVASSVQVFGEVLPSQKGYSYGFDAPSVLVFDVRIDGREVPYDSVPVSFKELWVPVIYDGPFDAVSVRGLSTGMETVSGKSLHIREGVVVRPYVDRRAEDGVKLRAKIINPKYKETGEEIN
jgi:hypothetical protein